MPEYVMPIGPDTAAAWAALPDPVKGFIEAAMYTSTAPETYACDWDDPDVQHRLAEGQLGGSIPADASFGDWEAEDVEHVKRFVTKFLAGNAAACQKACERPGYDLIRLGRDIYYTRAGHGVGFWDRDELAEGGLGDTLSKAVGYGEVNLDYFGGRICLYLA